jgi:hypothetical protein
MSKSFARTKGLALSCVLAASGVLAQDALSLFHRMQGALGGADRIAAIRDYEQVVRAESFDGNTGRSLGAVRKRTRWIAPGYLRVDQIGPGATYVLFFDGREGWEILPGTQRAVPLAGGELLFAQNYVRGFRHVSWLADRDSRYTITMPSQNVLRVADGDITHQLDITLDPATSLPVKTASISLSDPARPVASEELIKAWEVVGGIRFYRRWEVWRSGLRVAEATDARTTINTGLHLADLQAKPPDGKPTLSPESR